MRSSRGRREAVLDKEEPSRPYTHVEPTLGRGLNGHNEGALANSMMAALGPKVGRPLWPLRNLLASTITRLLRLLRMVHKGLC